MELRGKNLIYVGGFGGIGFASCWELLQRHLGILIIFDLREDVEKLSRLRTEYPKTRILYEPVDVTDRRGLEEAYRRAVQTMGGRLDVVINGGGVYDDQRPELTVRVNLLGLIESTLIAIGHMDRSAGGQGGLVVNIASITGLEPNPLMAIYSATKCGIVGFTRALADDFYKQRSGVSLLTICPGGTTTDLIANPVEKSTFKFASELHRQRNASSIKQSPEECAKCLVRAIEVGSNGSVWVCDLGKLERIEMPTIWSRKT